MGPPGGRPASASGSPGPSASPIAQRKMSTKELARQEDREHGEHACFVHRPTMPGVTPSVACFG